MAPENDNPDRGNPGRGDPDRGEQIAALLRGAAQSDRAPAALQARISAMQAQATAPRRRAWLPRRAFNLVRFGMPAAAAGVAALVIALGGAAGAPTLAQAAAISTRAPTSPAPAADPTDPGKLLTAKVGTLHFPNWESAGGWRAVGERHDQIGNRTATTVYYGHGSNRVVYSILSSPSLQMKTGAVTLPWSTLRDQYVATMRHDGRATVVWVESGHTCLLTGPKDMPPSKLWQLAFYGFRKPLSG
ncbi:MAG TPA: hypothetical protein VG293_05590 [Solirubrobacteraceae bacterium]|nr:hypothetical protein [Solirubrobacteraceae bacterium]